MPRKKITSDDEFFKRLDEFEFSDTKARRKRRRKTKKENHHPGYLTSIIVNGLLLYIFNHLLSWNISFLTTDFEKVLPILNISIGVSIFSNFLLIFDDEGKFGSFLRMVQNMFGIFFVFSVYNVFPFNLAHVSNSALIAVSLKIALLASIVGLGVAAMIEFFKLAFDK